MMLVEEAGEEFDNDALLNGELTPVFFGSALANFVFKTLKRLC